MTERPRLGLRRAAGTLASAGRRKAGVRVLTPPRKELNLPVLYGTSGDDGDPFRLLHLSPRATSKRRGQKRATPRSDNQRDGIQERALPRCFTQMGWRAGLEVAALDLNPRPSHLTSSATVAA